MLHLSENLRLIRLLSNLTQEKFGKKFNATKAMIKSYEGGKASPDELFMRRVAEFAGVSVLDIEKKKLSEKEIIISVEKGEKVSIVRDRDQLIGELFESSIKIKATVDVLVSTVAQMKVDATGKSLPDVLFEIDVSVDNLTSKRLDEFRKRSF